ncbi:MAG: glutathione S-transferase family protein [Candidatus Competibacteraceae bacterium]
MKFYSAWYCPFAQRAWITLLHKQLDFEYIEVDPYRKSRWWLEISRNSAKVPVIVQPSTNDTGNTTIIDSSRIVEYLEDLAPEINPILPETPNYRAEQRFWMDHVNTSIVPYFYRFLKAKDAGNYRNDSRKALISGLHDLAAAMSPNGPYFSGARIGAVDILLAPFAYRINTLLGHYRGFELPVDGEVWPRYQTWYQAMLKEPNFRATSLDHDNYRQRLIDHYFPYSQGSGQQDVTET